MNELNPHNAQLFMACHNASLLDHMEKEEIYFTEKTHDGRTQIYGLKDISGVRRVDNYYKEVPDRCIWRHSEYRLRFVTNAGKKDAKKDFPEEIRGPSVRMELTGNTCD